jgi:hypothetical protein
VPIWTVSPSTIRGWPEIVQAAEAGPPTNAKTVAQEVRLMATRKILANINANFLAYGSEIQAQPWREVNKDSSLAQRSQLFGAQKQDNQLFFDEC